VLNFVGVFTGRTWTDEEIKTAVEAGKDDWFPGSHELRRFAETGPGNIQFVSTIDEFVSKVIKFRPRRINLFTHAVPGTIMLTGRIAPGEVSSSGLEMGDLDPKVLKELGEIEEVRKSFQPGAELVIYACHSGSNEKVLKSLAEVLGVTVRGFSQDVRYWPVYGRAFDRVKRFTTWEYSVGDARKVSDFRNLLPDVTATP